MKKFALFLCAILAATNLLFSQPMAIAPAPAPTVQAALPVHPEINLSLINTSATFAQKEAEKDFPFMVEVRRYLHQYPEVSFKEEQTSKYIRQKLDALGIQYKIAGQYGIVAILKGAGPGKTVALRADMDALNIEELTNLDFKSKNNGVMHACGHDAHMAMLLAAADILNRNKSQFNGTIKILFQQAEEMGAGALMMIKAGVLDDVDAIFGIHQSAEFPLGEFHISEKSIMAANAIFTVKVTGKGGHGASPNLAIDALTSAAAMVQDLQYLVSREMAPQEPVVVSVCTFNSGTRANIIAETAEFSGTIRYFNPALQYVIENAFKRIIKGVGDAHRVTSEVKYLHAGIPTYNDPALTDLARATAASVVGPSKVVDYGRAMEAEDFAFYQQKKPGVFVFLGSGDSSKNMPLHSPRYDIVEESMITGAAMHVQFALNYLAAVK